MSTVAKKIVDPYNSFGIYNLVVLNQGGLKKASRVLPISQLNVLL